MASRSATSSRLGLSPAPARANLSLPKVIGRDNRGRVLCLADLRGRISNLNELAQEAGADAILHTGDFGFFENSSLERINDRTLRHLILYSPLVASNQRDQLLAEGNPISSLRASVAASPTPLLSEFPKLLSGELKLSVPVFTVWGACEDVTVLEKFRSGEYDIENLHILDEATTRCIDIGGVKLRMLGLGGALVPHKMFDNGDGHATIAGGQGTMWTTALQIGELVDTAQRTHDQSETRLFLSHASPGREGLIAQLALVLKADLTISAGLHFRYASSYNEFSVQSDMEAFRQKLASGKESFGRVWDNVKTQVEAVIDENQRILLDKCLSVVERVPPPAQGGAAGEEPAWKNCWNWNLCDAAYGHLVLDIKDGRVSSELSSQGFNYAYRRKADSSAPATAIASDSIALATANPAPSGLPASGTATLPVHTVKPSTGSKETENASKVNGASANSTAPGSPSIGSEKPSKKKVNKKEKEREREKKEEDKTRPSTGIIPDADRSNTPLSAAAAKPLPRSNAASPAPSTSAARPTQDSELLSPTNGTDSTGGRTPVTGRPPRNPNTLFLSHLPVPVTEEEVKEFFGPAQAGITSIKLPINHYSRQQRAVAFVEFGDREAMEAGLSSHAETLKDTIIKVSIAEDRTQNREVVDAGGRGGRPFRGAGRGGRGGYVARNGVVAAAQAAAGGRMSDGSRKESPGGKKPEGKKETA